MNVAIVGGGIAGLAAAFRLSARHEVALFEREARAGGKIRSQHLDGLLFDWGPNGFLSTAAELNAIVEELGLESELEPVAAAASKRFIFWNGRLHALPSKPPQALATALLSPAGKLRAAAEIFSRPPSREPESESVETFFTRHFGREVAQRIVAPALLGITGGDAGTSDASALFPRLYDLERAHGSVIRGFLRARQAPGKLLSFGERGMERVVDAMAARLGSRVRLGSPVDRIEPLLAGWNVHRNGAPETFDAVIVAAPADAAAALVDGCDAELAALLRRIPYAPMRVAGIAFRRSDVADALDGFGFLAARGEGVRILGALYTSTMFPAQAPAETAYLRVFLGGAGDPEAMALDEDAACAVVRRDLARVLGIAAEPVAYHETCWPKAIPQYALGHRALVRRIEERVRAHPALALAGNAYRGVGVGDAVRDAVAAASRFE